MIIQWNSFAKGILFLCCCTICVACHKPMRVVESRGEMVMIDSALDAVQDSGYLSFLQPIKEQLEAELNIPIGYAPKALTIHKPECTMLNWACDALLAMARQRYTDGVDMAVSNIGGMRCEWAAGDITYKDVFELMPFDNELVVLTLTGEEVLNLCQTFAQLGGEGVAGLRMQARNGKVTQATIDGKNIVPAAYYKVATSDYLSQGNDHIEPLARYIDIWRSEEKIRDLYIDYIRQVKTVQARVDGRMHIE